MGKGKYANARDVLPEALLKEVKKYYAGMLYVEKEVTSFKRQQMVMSLFKAETSTNEIAMIIGISTRRVNQIIATAGKESKNLSQ